MPRSSKSKSTKTKKQESPVEDIKEGASKMSTAAGKALSRTWTTVTGGKKSSSSRGKKGSKPSTHKSGRKSSSASSRRTTTASRSTGSKKAASTREPRTVEMPHLPHLKVYRLVRKT